ncbi:MAG: aminopeptidase P family protein [Halolamina sp.]
MTDEATLRRRLEAVQRRLRADDEGDGDAVVLFPGRNLQYLTDWYEEPGERHLLLFVPADGDPVFLVPALYEEELRTRTPIEELRVWTDDDDPSDHVAAVCDRLDLDGGRVLVDDAMDARFTQDLRAALPAATFGLASEVLGSMRLLKDDVEIAAMRRAAEAADAAVRELRGLGDDAVGMTEAELAEWIADRLAAHGGEGVSFEVIVGSGPNGAMPHHTHGDREIRAGEPVVLDFGTRIEGYPSDQTRTLVFGADAGDELPAEFRTVHRTVREAQDAAVEAVEPGATCEAVDAAARSVVEEAGYGEEFVHRTGHGVGLSVHERPYIVDGNDRELEPGMVFSVEPGVYRAGEFGVRVEDLVVVTETGCVRLNRTDRGWRC